MRYSSVLVLLFLLRTTSQAGEFLMSQIVSLEDYSPCSNIEMLEEKSVLVICQYKGKIEVVSWDGDWEIGGLDLNGFVPSEVTSAKLRSDLKSRIYIGSHQKPMILEVEKISNGKFYARGYKTPGVGVEGLSAGYSHRRKRDAIVINVIDKRKMNLRGRCGASPPHSLHFAYSVGGSFGFSLISESCGFPFSFNPWPSLKKMDVVIGRRIWFRPNGERSWRMTGKINPIRRNLEFSSVMGRYFTDSNEHLLSFNKNKKNLGYSIPILTLNPYEIKFDYPYQGLSRKGVDEVLGAFRSMAIGKLGYSDEERMYACDNRNLYEFELKQGKGWRLVNKIIFDGRPDRIHIGDLRKDGFNRLYVVERADHNLTRLFELTRFDSPIIVASSDFKIDIEKESFVDELIERFVSYFGPWLPEKLMDFFKKRDSLEVIGRGIVLGDMFRSILSKQKHIKLIDPEQMQRIIDERKLQSFLCEKEGCSQELGELLKADVTLENRVIRSGDYLALETKFFDVKTRERKALLTIEKWDGKNAYEAMERLARMFMRLWPVYKKD